MAGSIFRSFTELKQTPSDQSDVFGDQDNHLRGQGRLHQRRSAPQMRMAGHQHGQSFPLLNLGENLDHRLAHFKRVLNGANRTRFKVEAGYCVNVFLTHNHLSQGILRLEVGGFLPWKCAQHVIEVLETFVMNPCTGQPPHPSTKKSSVCDRIDQGIQIVVARLGAEVDLNKLGRHSSGFHE